MTHFLLASSPQWCMMDVSRLNILLATVSCPSCDGTDVLHLTPCDSKRLVPEVDLFKLRYWNKQHLLVAATCHWCEAKALYDQRLDGVILQSSGAGAYSGERVLCHPRDTCHAPENVSEEAACDRWQDDQGDRWRDADKRGHRSQDAPGPRPWLPCWPARTHHCQLWWDVAEAWPYFDVRRGGGNRSRHRTGHRLRCALHLLPQL